MRRLIVSVNIYRITEISFVILSAFCVCFTNLGTFLLQIILMIETEKGGFSEYISKQLTFIYYIYRKQIYGKIYLNNCAYEITVYSLRDALDKTCFYKLII